MQERDRRACGLFLFRAPTENTASIRTEGPHSGRLTHMTEVGVSRQKDFDEIRYLFSCWAEHVPPRAAGSGGQTDGKVDEHR